MHKLQRCEQGFTVRQADDVRLVCVLGVAAAELKAGGELVWSLGNARRR